MATIKDIASRVGVSPGTVDRILNNRGRFSQETAERVFEAVKELKYTPNIHARGLKKTATFKFAAILPEPHLDAGYWEMVRQGVCRAGKELKSFGCIVKIFTYNYHQQQDYELCIQNILEWGPQALLVAASDSETFGVCIAKLNLPVVLIDSDIEALSNRIAYIGQDTYRSGVLAAKLMRLLICEKSGSLRADSEKGPVLILNPVYANPYLKMRLEGFIEYHRTYFSDIPSVEINQIIEPDEYPSLLQYYFSNPNKLPSGLFITNASVYDFGKYLQSLGEPYCSIPVVGYDLIPQAANLLENDIINFVLTQQPIEQGYLGVKTLYDRFVLNQPIAERHIMPLNIITKENLHTFLQNLEYMED